MSCPVDFQVMDNTREPLLTRATITAGVTLAAALLAVFGIRVNQDTRDTIVKVTLCLAPLPPIILGWWARRHVSPSRKPDIGEEVSDGPEQANVVETVTEDVGSTVNNTVGGVVDTLGAVTGGLKKTITDIIRH